MLDLTNTQQLIPLLQKHHLYTQKSFGQHFLINRQIIDLALQAADIKSSDTVIEVGAGTGVLTRELAKRAHQVITFEIDQHFEPLLTETLGEYPNVSLIFKDFLKVNLTSLFQEQLQQLKNDSTSITPAYNYKFVANLPYNVGSHIIDLLVNAPIQPQSITVLLQKEVAQKFTAKPPHATYLSNFIQLYGEAHYLHTVKPGNFFPPPKVDSALIYVKKHPIEGVQSTTNIGIDSTALPSFSHFLHRGFSQPRKMINKSFTKEELEQAHIDPNLRPENLTFKQWVELYKVMGKTNQLPH
jgi:16S rRNA (adenine1518-N6/adenine1519-N6)-dimethyltransferase